MATFREAIARNQGVKSVLQRIVETPPMIREMVDREAKASQFT